MTEILQLFFSQRIGQVEFIFRAVMAVVAFYAGAYFCRMIPENSAFRTVGGLILGISLLMYLLYFVLFPRVIDLRLPRLGVLLVFVPILNLLLVLAIMFAPHDYWHEMRARIRLRR